MIKRTIGIILLCFALSGLTSFDLKTDLTTEKFAIIVHKDNPMTSLTESEVKLYYLRKIKKRWPVINKNIRPADRKKDCEERSAFYQFLGLTDNEIEQYFVNKQLQNAERPPDKFLTEEEMINFVADEIGAIGYIKASSVSAELKLKVKVVFRF